MNFIIFIKICVHYLQHTIGKICSLLKIVHYLEQTFCDDSDFMGFSLQLCKL